MSLKQNTATPEGNESIISRVNQINAKTQAWLDESPQRGAGMLTADLETWHQDQVFNGEQLDHHMLASEIYEATREIHGYKPSWTHLINSTPQELQENLAGLKKCVEDEREHLQRQEQRDKDHEEWCRNNIRTDDSRKNDPSRNMVSLANAFPF